MKKILTFLVSTLFILLFENSAIAKGDIFIKPNIKDQVRLESFVDGLINGQLDANKYGAVALSIVKDGELILSKTYGLQNLDGVSLTPNRSLFRIGSTSKTFTYTAIMQLYEQGKLDLDTDVNEYLKDFKIPSTFADPITIKHILTHTAGFEDSMLGHLFVPSTEQIIPIREAVEKYMPERIHPVGKYSSYSNYGVSLLGVIIENVTKVAFEDYIETSILKPLSMNNSTFQQPLPDLLEKDRVTVYYMNKDILTPRDLVLITNDTPAGGMSTTATDMAQFMMMFLNEGEVNGNRILQTKTAKLMPNTLVSPNVQYPGMAYGFLQKNINGHLLFGHPGGTLYFNTDMMMDASENLGIFISTTAEKKIARNFIQHFYDYYFPQNFLLLKPPTDFSERAVKYSGQYLNWRSNFSGIEKLLQLLSSISVQPTGNMLLIADNHYVEVGKHLFQKLGGKELILFSEDELGNIIDLHFLNMPPKTWSKAPFFYFDNFNFSLLGLSQLAFFIVLLSFIYRRKEYKQHTNEERKAIYVSLATACTNMIFILVFFITAVSYGVNIIFGFPTFFKIALILPIIATVLALVQLYFAVYIWKNELLSLTKRINYSVVTACALFMGWFYFFWNVLGFQYHIM